MLFAHIILLPPRDAGLCWSDALNQVFMENSKLNISDPSLELITLTRAPELMQIQMRRCEGVVLLMWGRRLSSNEWMMNYAHHSGGWEGGGLELRTVKY